MDIAIQTGATRPQSGTTLVAHTFSGSGKERACLLLQARARGQDSDMLEDECVQIIKNALLGTDGEAWNRLDGTLKELNGLFKGLMLGGNVTDAHAIVALIEKDGMLHASHAGRGEGWLLRHGAASQITEFSRGKPLPSFIHISSGQLESGDIVILSTQRLMRAVTPAQLGQLHESEGSLLGELIGRMQSEDETASLATVHVDLGSGKRPYKVIDDEAKAPRRGAGRRSASRNALLPDWRVWLEKLQALLEPLLFKLKSKGGPRSRKGSKKFSWSAISKAFSNFLADLRDPKRRKRAHILLVAAALGAFLIIWLVVKLATDTQRNKTREQLALLIEQIGSELQAAESRHIAGDTEAANAILARAEERAKQVIADESRLYRTQAMDLLSRVRQKRDAINNITKVTDPRLAADLAAKYSAVTAQGLVGIRDGELVAFDKQRTFRIVSTIVSDPLVISSEELLVDGAVFERYESQVFLTSGETLLELTGTNEVTSMKTDDPGGWTSGIDVETYGRFLYVLSPATKQIYKYERLTNRYGTAVPYNVNGDLIDGIDMVIDQSVYVLKKGGTIVKLLRGESQPFVIRQAPANLLTTATKIFKVAESNFYLLDPENNRVLVITDGGPAGESSYVRQFILEGEQIGLLQDLYVDTDETHLYVMDEKKVYVIDLQ
jgi:hypothetical protein